MRRSHGFAKHGFTKILETVIAAIIILTSLSFFFSVKVVQSGWDDSIAELRAQDAVSAGYKTGSIQDFVRNNDASGLRTYLSRLLSEATDFSVEITGIPNSVTFMGCYLCDAGELNDITGRLHPLVFTYKGRQVEIRVENVDVANLPEETNVLLFMEFTELENEYSARRDKIERFVADGGAVFLLDDLTETEAGSGVMRDLFSLTWNTADSGLTDNGRFRDPSNPETITYNIANYYENITGHRAGNENFARFDTDGNNINRINVDERTVIETANKKFSFVKVNRNVINGNGRTVWFAENSRSVEINNLTKAAVMWASGERYRMDGPAEKRPPRGSQSSRMLIHDFDTYEFRLTTWNVF